MGKLSRRLTEHLVIILVVVGTFLISPRITFDPIIIPRLGGLVLLATPLFILILSSLRNLPVSVLLVSSLFIVWMLISSLFNSNPLERQLYGEFGRNTGVLTYFSLFIAFLAVTLICNQDFVERAVKTMVVCGLSISLYGLVQWVGLDPVEWTNQFEIPVMGTFGNPNFMSSFLGIYSTLLFHLMTKAKREKLLLYLISVSLNLLLILETQSIQGLVLYAIGLISSTFLKLSHHWSRSPKIYKFGALSMIVFFMVLLVSLRNRIFESVLSNETLEIRWHYWTAGIKMGLQEPLFGLGFDSYGDWYRANRSNAAVKLTGESVVTNAAHNVFIDILVNGGIPLLLLYISLLTLIFKSAIRILRNKQKQDALYWALVVAWICFVIQSLISINHLGLAIWGWFLGGTILGIDLNLTDKTEIYRSKGWPLIKLYVGFIVGAIVVGPPVAKDYFYMSALESGLVVHIERFTNSFPESTAYYHTTAEIFASNELKDKELLILKAAVSFNERDFISWKRMLQSPLITVEEKRDMFLIAKLLEPRYSFND